MEIRKVKRKKKVEIRIYMRIDIEINKLREIYIDISIFFL